MLYQIETRDNPFTASIIHRLAPRPHIHPHLELIYLKTGCSIAAADSHRYELNGGDLFLAFPNQIHFYHDQKPVEGYMLIFSPDFLTDLKEVFQTKTPTESVLHREQLPPDILEKLDTIHQKMKSPASFSQLSAKGCLLALLGELLPQMSLCDAPADQESIKKLLTYCTENYTEPLSLESLSKELHLNKYYISHIFQERMGISYKDFINSLRVEHACKLLTKNSHITEVAYASGFTTIRTFNRAFLKHMEITPREYIKAQRGSGA